jgi:DNA-binding response OmpR family regulator
MSGGGDQASVLVVDDEPEIAEMLTMQLRRHYDVEAVGGGEAALEAVDDDVDVVLLDRRMPEQSGDEVLATLRDRGWDGRVVMVSAVTPDYDVLELPFDDYLRKPAGGDDLLEVVERQLEAVDGDRRTYRRLVAKRDLLADVKPTPDLEDHDGYQELLDRLATLRDRLDEDVETA